MSLSNVYSPPVHITELRRYSKQVCVHTRLQGELLAAPLYNIPLSLAQYNTKQQPQNNAMETVYHKEIEIQYVNITLCLFLFFFNQIMSTVLCVCVCVSSMYDLEVKSVWRLDVPPISEEYPAL